MTAQPFEPVSLITIVPAPAGAAPSALSVTFQPAPEKPALGQPGSATGDVTLISPNTAVVSLGKDEKISPETIRQAGGLLARWLFQNHVPSVDIDTAPLAALDGIPALAEGLYLGAFRFERYKKSENGGTSVVVNLIGVPQSLHEPLTQVQIVTAAVNLARDWAHEPANVINPVTLAERAVHLAQLYGLKVSVLDDKQLAAMGAGAIVAVGKASKTPARLIVLEHSGTNPEVAPIVLIGKGLTFDTGGYSLKDVANILGMKYDKSGAIDVIATLVAVARLNLPQRVIGVIGAAENMISGEGYRPDDILTTLSGKTVEIISTDAEGRLVLADCLTYAQQTFKPRLMIDLATLTGGAVVALGHVRAALLSNDDALAAALYAAGERTYERLWRMPLDEEYAKAIKSDDADIKNSGGREASCISGGMFLKQFVDDSVPWAHLDIAGTADTTKDGPYTPKGGTGFGVRLLIDYLKNL